MRHPETPRRRLIAAIETSEQARQEYAELLAEQNIDLVSGSNSFDLLIVDLRQSALGRVSINSAAAAARRRAGSRPVLFLAGPGQFTNDQIGKVAQTDLVIPAAASARAMVSAIRRAVSDVDRSREVSVRLQTMAALGVSMVPPGIDEPVDRTLLLAEACKLFLPVHGELSVRTQTEAVIQGSQALQILESEQADALFILAARNRRPQSSLIRLLRRHSRLGALPVIVIEEDAVERHVNYWTASGADAVISPEEIPLGISFANRIRRGRNASLMLEQMLAQSNLTDTGEPSRLASPRFFEACLSERLASSDTSFAVAAMRLDPNTGQNHLTALSEVAVYVSLALRPTDMVTRPAPDLFLISFPSTTRAQAQTAVQALTRMITDLKFGSQDCAATFIARTNFIMSAGQKSAADLIPQLIHGLPAAEAPLIPA